MRPFAFMDHRVRGFRVVEVGALSILLILILAVYLAKTGAGTRRADIQHVQAQIDDEHTQIRLLKAEVATLEQPERLENLASKYLGLAPTSARRDITAAALSDVARTAEVGGGHQATAVNDPLTAKGSPDLLPEPGAVAAPPAPSTATPTTTPAATKPVATGAPKPIKVAEAATTASPHTPGAAPARETR